MMIPGKVILTGEHSVVYGYPALTVSLPFGIEAQLDDAGLVETTANPVIAAAWQVYEDVVRQSGFSTSKKNSAAERWTITSQLAIGSGLGSSSALAAAVLQTWAHRDGWFGKQGFPPEKLAELVWRVEQTRYPTASPIDAYTVAKPGLWQFSKNTGKWQSEQLQTAHQTTGLWDHFVLIQSGLPQESTADMVKNVTTFLDERPEKKQILSALGALVPRYRAWLAKLSHQHYKEATVEIKELLRTNQRLLEELPIVGQPARSIIAEIEAAGGAAKITGAGGFQAGSGMILAYLHDSDYFSD